MAGRFFLTGRIRTVDLDDGTEYLFRRDLRPAIGTGSEQAVEILGDVRSRIVIFWDVIDGVDNGGLKVLGRNRSFVQDRFGHPTVPRVEHDAEDGWFDALESLFLGNRVGVYEGGGPFAFPAAGTGMVFKVKGGNKGCKIDQSGSESTLKMSGVVTDETLGRIAADGQHRFFISCKGSIFSDYFCLIPKGSDAYLKANDVSLNFKRKKTTLTFKIGPTYANKYFNLGTFSEGSPFVENLLVQNTFSGKNSNIYNQDKDPFNNSTVSFYHGWITHPDMYGGQSFNLTDKGNQYCCDNTAIVEGAKVAMKFSLSKKNHKFKLTMKSVYNIGCYFRFTKE